MTAEPANAPAMPITYVHHQSAGALARSVATPVDGGRACLGQAAEQIAPCSSQAAHGVRPGVAAFGGNEPARRLDDDCDVSITADETHRLRRHARLKRNERSAPGSFGSFERKSAMILLSPDGEGPRG